MCKNKTEACNPNETTKHDLEGFLIDMIEMIANHPSIKFQYELYLSPDGNYGSKNDKGEWNGMIRELMIGVRFNLLAVFYTVGITTVRSIIYTKFLSTESCIMEIIPGYRVGQ